jgi:hypothetical protein
MVVNAHPLICEAIRQAEKLARYRILPGHHGVVLWLFKERWIIVQPYSDRAAAEAALFALLPAITHPPDIVRPGTEQA